MEGGIFICVYASKRHLIIHCDLKIMSRPITPVRAAQAPSFEYPLYEVSLTESLSLAQVILRGAKLGAQVKRWHKSRGDTTGETEAKEDSGSALHQHDTHATLHLWPSTLTIRRYKQHWTGREAVNNEASLRLWNKIKKGAPTSFFSRKSFSSSSLRSTSDDRLPFLRKIMATSGSGMCGCSCLLAMPRKWSYWVEFTAFPQVKLFLLFTLDADVVFVEDVAAFSDGLQKEKEFNLSMTGMKDLCIPGKDGAVHLTLVIQE